MNESDIDNSATKVSDDLPVINEAADESSVVSTLDLNKDRQGSIPVQHRFSVTKVTSGLKNIDATNWQNDTVFPENSFFSYPSVLDKAILHQQCCYLQPDLELIKDMNENSCPCCNKPLHRKRINWLTYDVYGRFVREYGITVPLYFTFLKTHITIMTFQFLIYGIFFIIMSREACLKYETDPTVLDCDNCDPCEFVHSYQFITMANLQKYVEQNHWKSQLLQGLSFFVFMINILVPFIHEIIIKYTRTKYWEYEDINHLKDHKKSVYVKHLPHKMTQKEIQTTIQRALNQNQNPQIRSKSFLFDSSNVTIQELVYIYDIHEIKEMNEVRIQIFLDALLISRQLKEIQQNGYIQTYTPTQRIFYINYQIQSVKNKNLVLSKEILEIQFKQKISDLVFETTRMKQYQKNGLPFTNKIILKFFTNEQRDAVYNHYGKSKWEHVNINIYSKTNLFKLLTRIKVIKRSVEEMKLQKQSSKVLDYEDCDKDVIQSQSQTGSVMEGLIQDFKEEYEIEQQKKLSQNIKPYAKKSLFVDDGLKLMQADYTHDRVDTKELRVHKGFYVSEIFWENIGMHTLTRLILRIRSVIITFVACGMMMGLFELMYIYQNNPSFTEQKKNGQLTIKQKIIATIFTVLVSVVSTISTLVLLGQAAKAKRTTYTEQEHSIVQQILFVQLILVQSFPFIMSLQVWDGLNQLLPIYDLVQLAQNKLIFRLLFNTVHIRSILYFFRKRGALKNYKPHLFFQGQLNTILTPPQFPNRGRLLGIFFIYTVGVTMLYLCPMVMIFCLLADIYLYFFDKRSVLKMFTVDRMFTIKHMGYFIKAYQYIITPVNVYLYIKIFWYSKYCTRVAMPLMIIVTLVFIFFKRRLTRFIVNILLKKKLNKIEREEESYFQAYNDFYQSLMIEDFTTLLTNLFKQVSSQEGKTQSENKLKDSSEIGTSIQGVEKIN